MLILGDLALTAMMPHVGETLELAGPEEGVLINLEGAVVDASLLEKYELNSMVYNSDKVIGDINKDKNIIFGLANNHIFDIPKYGDATLENLRLGSIKATGAWSEAEDFSQPVRYIEKGKKVSVVAAGWDVIGCMVLEGRGVNQLDTKKLSELVCAEKKISDIVVVYLHWGYELEIYPHPADRSLARELIDSGADLIVGTHAHCLLGHEIYNGVNIFYGLGNFAFTQNIYFNKKIIFPDVSTIGLGLIFDVCDLSVIPFGINNKNESLIKSDNKGWSAIQGSLDELSKPFTLSAQGYIDFFKKNRRKRVLLPIFYAHDQSLGTTLSKIFLRWRTRMISYLFYIGLKKGPN